MFCAGPVVEEAAVLLMVTRAEPAMGGRQGSSISCSICWLHSHSFQVFGRETFSFPKPTLWERQREPSWRGQGRPPALSARPVGHARQAPTSSAASPRTSWEGRPCPQGLGVGWHDFDVLRTSDSLRLPAVFRLRLSPLSESDAGASA